jgi:hypothetical protein
MENVVTEREARRIFHDKLPICDVLGLDVRGACIQAGVPAPLVDRILQDHAAKTAATRRCISDPSVMPVGSPSAAVGAVGRGAGNDPVFHCLGQKLTGLPMIVWVFRTGASEGPPYLRVQADHSTAPRTDGSCRVSVHEVPRQLDGLPMAEPDFTAVTAFIRANRAVLTSHWNGAESSIRLMRKIVPVR